MNTCACGCGHPLPDSDHPAHRFITGHNNRLRMLDDKTCEVCGAIYHPLYAEQKYCSRACYNVVRSQGQRKRVQRTCEVCGQSFEVQAYRADSRFCSNACRKQRNPPSEKTCPYCGQTFTSYDRDATYCSRRCSRKEKTGPKSTAWKGGVSLDRKRARLSGELQAWRKAVHRRDHYTCQICGSTGDIHAHHVKEFAAYPELRFDVANGLTVCIPCHEAIHGRKIGTPKQYPDRCMDCGAPTKGRSWRCRSCARSHAHLMEGHKQPKTCPRCGATFVKRADSVYCSGECAQAAAVALIEIACEQCGRLIQRSPAQLATRNRHFCSEACQHAHARASVIVACPVCQKLFVVKPYRLANGKTPTCSLTCRNQLRHPMP